MLAVVVLSHSRRATSLQASVSTMSQCADLGAGEFCTAIAGLSRILHDPALPLPRQDILPPPTVTGTVDPRITQANIGRTICVPGYSRSARPSYAITGPLKRRMMGVEHPGAPEADYELDHLIPISLGGAPLEARDLWLQPRRGQGNAADKNLLSYVLWRLVCERQVPLATAQAAISRDWTRAYGTYVTPDTQSKYRFHPAADDHS